MDGARPVPVGALAPVDPSALHLPDFSAPPVAPIEAPEGTIRIGSAVVARSDAIDPGTADRINDSAAQAEASLAQGLDSTGLPPSRSDRIAADTLGGAAAGAAIGAGVSSPVAAAGALVGGVAGLVAGVPFLPAGLVVVPPLGAAMGAAAVTIPATAVGAAAGAGAGALGGALAPPTAPADQPGTADQPDAADSPETVD